MSKIIKQYIDFFQFLFFFQRPSHLLSSLLLPLLILLILLLHHLLGYINMMPAQGAWGVWYLPGSKEFHVAWTGVVEFLAGLWLTIGAVSTAIFGISLPDAFQLGTGTAF